MNNVGKKNILMLSIGKKNLMMLSMEKKNITMLSMANTSLRTAVVALTRVSAGGGATGAGSVVQLMQLTEFGHGT